MKWWGWWRRTRPEPPTPTGRHRADERLAGWVGQSAEALAAAAARQAAERRLIAARALAARSTPVARTHAAIDQTNHIGELFANAWGGRT